MGKNRQYTPANLPAKLFRIRHDLGLSQSQLLRLMSAHHSHSSARISEYEAGTRTPSLLILMAYARVARVPLEVLIDDEAILPNRLPGNFVFARYKRKKPTQIPIPAAARKKSEGMSSKVNTLPQDASMSSFDIMRWVVGGV